MDLLVLAFYLSVLSYYLGVLIYVLPIPFYGLKRWAPQLMIDGVFSAILVFSYNTIKWVMKYIGGLLGVDWSSYYTWLAGEINIVLGSIITLKVIGTGLSSIGLNFLANSLISPLISSLTYLLIFLVTVSTLITVLTTLSDTLLALGIALHAVPFRLTRSSGATIISLIIVFSIGTPLMPQFIDSISVNTSLAHKLGYGYLLAKITVYDYTGDPIPYYLYEVYSENKTLLARYLADANGVVNATSIYKGIPFARHYISVKLAGYEYWQELDPGTYSNVSTTHVVIKLVLKDIIVLRPLRFTTLFNIDNYTVTYKDETLLNIHVNTRHRGYMIVVGLANDQLFVYSGDAVIAPSETYSYTWGYVDFKAHNYSLGPGQYRLTIVISGDSEEKPFFEEKYYARDTLGLLANEAASLVYPISLLIFRLFIAPIIYLSILFSAALALSRILGGSSPKIARVLVSGV